MLPPINFKAWIEEHRHLLKPPVGNQCVYEDSEFIIMVVGGPNTRADYHINQSEEFFYQVEGDINLKLKKGQEFVDMPIREGEIFLLPPGIPHSPQRPANTVGLVIERKRREGELDGFVWFCENCQSKVFDKYFFLTDIVKQLPPVFAEFYDNESNATCKNCGHHHKRD